MKLALIMDPRDVVSYVETLSLEHEILAVVLPGPNSNSPAHLSYLRSKNIQVAFQSISKWRGISALLDGLNLDFIVGVNYYLEDTDLKELKELCEFKTKNYVFINYSNLPDYYGFDPLHWKLRTGDYSIDCSFYKLSAEKNKIHHIKNFKSDVELQRKDFMEMLLETQNHSLKILFNYLENPIPDSTEMDITTGKPAPGVMLSQLKITPQRTRKEILNLVNACNPYFGAWTMVDKTAIIVWKITETPNEGYEIPCSDGTLYVEIGQLEHGYYTGKELKKLVG